MSVSYRLSKCNDSTFCFSRQELSVKIIFMKIVVQRVKRAKVILSKTGKVKGEIGKGLLLLIGVGKKDDEEKAKLLAEKVSKLRVMADKEGKMNLSINDLGSGILAVSQFTLYADTSKGNRPSFVEAADPKKAEEIYNVFVDGLKKRVEKVETGGFGAYMEIEADLDGPVTILLEE
jgi:D-tyrosyl-tRNA(Tyr) deacylase